MEVEHRTFADDGAIPNSALPLIVYRGAIAAGEASPEAFEALFAENRWPPAWRASVFTFHHYHSTAHETLGVARGEARVIFGGPSGEAFDITAGDVVVIPAGVGHCRLSARGDFLVVGAYPPGQSWDLMRGEPGERPQADENIARVPMPESDPVQGPDGALLRLWGEVAGQDA